MKILSPFKDYYDYIQGIYGIDEKIVYERIHYSYVKDKWEKCPLFKPDYITVGSDYEDYYLAICGTIYHVCIINNKFYFGMNYDSFKRGEYNYIVKFMSDDNVKKLKESLPITSLYSRRNNYHNYHLSKTLINEKNNCPVILLSSLFPRYEEVKSKNIRLSDFGINQIISPNDMYLKISQWLSKEKEIIDNRTNKEKIIGNGFDLKTSFRK